jgi:hypothetical protein
MVVLFAVSAGRPRKLLVGAIVQIGLPVAVRDVQPGSVDGMLKVMVSPEPSLFACWMAQASDKLRDEQVVVSAVVVTTRVEAACAVGARLPTLGASNSSDAAPAVRTAFAMWSARTMR